MGFEVRTAPLHISAAPYVVYDALLDLERWKQWSPRFRISASRVAPGARALIHIGFLPGPTLVAPGRIHRAEPGRLLSWGGGVPGLLALDHGFELSLAPGGGSTVVHYERFDGALGGTARALQSVLSSEYERMNAALRDHVESLVA